MKYATAADESIWTEKCSSAAGLPVFFPANGAVATKGISGIINVTSTTVFPCRFFHDVRRGNKGTCQSYTTVLSCGYLVTYAVGTNVRVRIVHVTSATIVPCGFLLEHSVATNILVRIVHVTSATRALGTEPSLSLLFLTTQGRANVEDLAVAAQLGHVVVDLVSTATPRIDSLFVEHAFPAELGVLVLSHVGTALKLVSRDARWSRGQGLTPTADDGARIERCISSPNIAICKEEKNEPAGVCEGSTMLTMMTVNLKSAQTSLEKPGSCSGGHF